MGWDYWQYRAQPKWFIVQVRQAMASEAMALRLSQRKRPASLGERKSL